MLDFGGVMLNRLEKVTDNLADYIMLLLLWMSALVAIVGCGGLILFVGWAAIKGLL